MASGPSLVVERLKRSPTIPMRPGIHAPSFKTSTFRPPSADSVIRMIVPSAVRYTSEEGTPQCTPMRGSAPPLGDHGEGGGSSRPLGFALPSHASSAWGSTTPAAMDSLRLFRAMRRSSRAATFLAFTASRCLFPKVSGMHPSYGTAGIMNVGIPISR
jgi:hypothetical protein